VRLSRVWIDADAQVRKLVVVDPLVVRVALAGEASEPAPQCDDERILRADLALLRWSRLRQPRPSRCGRTCACDAARIGQREVLRPASVSPRWLRLYPAAAAKAESGGDKQHRGEGAHPPIVSCAGLTDTAQRCYSRRERICRRRLYFGQWPGRDAKTMTDESSSARFSRAPGRGSWSQTIQSADKSSSLGY
jgi:hypothetical protein